ncbi:MAG TPA: DUF2231 domain-containing protein [Sphingobacteriaceae bacterium]
MRSKAHVKSHPLHPILIPFPIAFLTGALLFDVLAIAMDDLSFRQTAEYLLLAGIISAVVTAIPGLIDYLYSVPPQSSGKKRAMKHGMLNTAHLILFIIVYLLRMGDQEFSDVVIVLLEAVGVMLLMIAGWMGGTLVHRNMIGIDHRYAHAGKWKESYFEELSGPVNVGASSELKVNQMKLLHLRGKRIVLARTETGYAAFEDRCTHRGGSLADGSMMCGTVQCPWHGSQFDVHTGEVKAGPADEAITSFPVKEMNGSIFLDL